MKINEIIADLQATGSWVKWNRATRDRVLFGDIDQTVTGIGVCWVASEKAIQQAIKQNVNLIISHENAFYKAGTCLETQFVNQIEKKQQLLSEHGICIYRCHDVWDAMPEYGVSDQWAKRLGYPLLQKRVIDSYYQWVKIETLSVKDVAQHIANVVKKDGEEGLYVFGDVDKKINTLALGTGAATNLFEMISGYDKVDALVVSDDGITNYCEVQFALDSGVPLIVVNHAGCEMCGIEGMERYFKQKYPDLLVQRLNEGYDIHYYLGK